MFVWTMGYPCWPPKRTLSQQRGSAREGVSHFILVPSEVSDYRAYLQERPPGLIQLVLTVLVLSRMLLVPRLPASVRSLRLCSQTGIFFIAPCRTEKKLSLSPQGVLLEEGLERDPLEVAFSSYFPGILASSAF